MNDCSVLNVLHNSLKPLMVKDSHGNYPFWYRCSAIDEIDVLTDDFQPVLDIFSLIVVKGRTSDMYALKEGYLILKHGEHLYRFILNNEMCDYDIQPYIDQGNCWFKECQTKDSSNDFVEDV